jgi:hypothetical protein
VLARVELHFIWLSHINNRIAYTQNTRFYTQPRRKEENRDNRKENYDKGQIYPCHHMNISKQYLNVLLILLSSCNIAKAPIYLKNLFPVVLMEETMNTTETTKEEALINAGFRKRYFFSWYK